jgi:hypothetical protein
MYFPGAAFSKHFMRRVRARVAVSKIIGFPEKSG